MRRKSITDEQKQEYRRVAYYYYKEGLTQEEMKEALNRITTAVNAADVTDNQVAKELKDNILDAAAIGEKQIQAMFAANAVTSEDTPSEGGEE